MTGKAILYRIGNGGGCGCETVFREVLPQMEIPEKGTQGHPCFAITTGVRLTSHTNNQETDGLSIPRLPWTLCLFNGCDMIRLITHSGGILMVTDDLVTIWRQWLLLLTSGTYKYSLLMYRIKIKSPAKFLWNEQNVFSGWIYFVSISSYSGGVTMIKKPIGYWRYYQSRCRPPRSHGALRPHHELTLQISCNIFFNFLVNVNDEIRRQCITLYDR